MPGFQETVASAWQSIHQADPFLRLLLKMQATA
jgi:hypothetical protein